MLRISDEAYEYLVVQVGELSALRLNRPRWEEAYGQLLRLRMDEIRPHLPPECGSILDVGSGLGGMDVMLHRHYDRGPWITLMDGAEAPAEMRLHRKPFSSARVAMEFLRDNGIAEADFVDVDRPPYPEGKHDLIVSFRAWCFHLPPREYLGYIRECCHPATTVIVDLRHREDWRRELLESVFRGVCVQDRGGKVQRWVLRPR